MLISLTVVYVVYLEAGHSWETESYRQWSEEEAKWVLNNSPWTATASAGVRQTPIGFADTLGSPDAQIAGRKDILVSVLYLVRLFTARPIREAAMRLLSLGQLVKTAIGAEEITKTSDQEQQASVDRFLTGSDKYIIIAPSPNNFAAARQCLTTIFEYTNRCFSVRRAQVKL